MIVRNRKGLATAKPDNDELADFTNKFYNLLTLFKSGKTPVKETLFSIQQIADGAVVLEEMFKRTIIQRPVTATQGGALKQFEEFGLFIGFEDSFKIITKGDFLESPCHESCDGYIEVFEFKRSLGTNPLHAWNLILEGDEEKNITRDSDIRIERKLLAECRAFSPTQILQMIKYGSMDADGSPEWSYKNCDSNFVLCQVEDAVCLLDVRFDQGSQPRTKVWINSIRPNSFRYGDRLILKCPLD